jgi:hypothetical protein
MSNTILTIIGWGLFYWAVFLYIFWVLVERTFFAGSDQKRWDPTAHVDVAPAGAAARRPVDAVPSTIPLRRTV